MLESAESGKADSSSADQTGLRRPMVILYVRDQAKAREFYSAVLDREPDLDVPGMTEFALGNDLVLGLMPEAGIRKLLAPALRDPAEAAGIARCELYLTVPDAERHLARAVSAGAALLSPMAPRDWGDRAGYCQDPDGHVLAFAEA